jgi:hypothetical protein
MTLLLDLFSHFETKCRKVIRISVAYMKSFKKYFNFRGRKIIILIVSNLKFLVLINFLDEFFSDSKNEHPKRDIPTAHPTDHILKI